MRWFFLTQRRRLLVFCMDDLQGRTQNEHVTLACSKCEKMSATMVGRQRKFLISDGLKHSQMHFLALDIVQKLTMILIKVAMV